MLEEDQQPLTRSEKKRSDYHKKKRNDRLLNILIAFISILIIVNLIALLTDDKKQSKEVVKEGEKSEQHSNTSINTEEEETETVEGQGNESTTEDPTSDEDLTSIEQGASDNESENAEVDIVVVSSDDPNVIEAIENPQWDVTPTQQTGEHISAYQEGHRDYEEKLLTFRNVVNLDENNIIYWSVKNNGSTSTSVGVVSTMDKSEMYRVYIEWIDGKGWKPVRLEKLRQVEGAY